MDLKSTAPPDRSEAIKDLIERWIEKNKAKEPTPVAAVVPEKPAELKKTTHD
jgi:metal-responsive CopG/Arc/MetJ family transcriptional regulator